jgi:hypothetical protein
LISYYPFLYRSSDFKHWPEILRGIDTMIRAVLEVTLNELIHSELYAQNEAIPLGRERTFQNHLDNKAFNSPTTPARAVPPKTRLP